MSREADELLDRCIEEARAGRDPEAILREHPGLAEEVRPLVALARELEALPAPAASAGGLSRLLTRVAALEGSRVEGRGSSQGEEGTREERAQAPPRRRRGVLRAAAWASAAAAAAILAGWVLVRTSQGALPGDRLYPIKRLGERGRYLLAFAPEGRAELRLRFADLRLHEAYRKYMDGRGLDAGLLGQMAWETRRALELAARLPEARLGRVLEQAAWSFQSRCDMMEELERRASAEERQVLAPFAASCRQLRECMRLGPWGDRPGSAAETFARMRDLVPATSAKP